jgi:hypothetical protein
LAIAIAFLVAATGVAGCGESSHDKLIRSANAVCRSLTRQEQAISPPRDRATLGSVTARLTPLLANAQARLVKLRASGADGRALARFRAALARQAVLSRSLESTRSRSSLYEVQRRVQKLAAAEDVELGAAVRLGLAAECRSPRPVHSNASRARRDATREPTQACPQIIGFPYQVPQPSYGRLVATRRSVGTVVQNGFNGPGLFPYGERTYPIGRAHAAGIRVLGYVFTRFGHRPLAEVERDIDTWRRWYSVDGFFVDNVSVIDRAGRGYYEKVAAYIRRGRGKEIVLNAAGDPTNYLHAGDVQMVWESPYAQFRRWKPPGWTSRYPARRLAAIVYATPESGYAKTLERLRRENIGNVYVTDLHPPNPYAALPPYFPQLARSLAAGRCA